MPRPYPFLYCGSGLLWILGEPVGRELGVNNEGDGERGGRDALDARYPVLIAQLEEARGVLGACRAQLALRVLDGRLGPRRGVHVARGDGACELAPEPTALVWLLLVVGRDPLGCDAAAVLRHVE